MDLAYRTRWSDQVCINKLNNISIVMYVQNRVELGKGPKKYKSMVFYQIGGSPKTKLLLQK